MEQKPENKLWLYLGYIFDRSKIVTIDYSTLRLGIGHNEIKKNSIHI